MIINTVQLSKPPAFDHIVDARQPTISGNQHSMRTSTPPQGSDTAVAALLHPQIGRAHV